MKRGNAVAARMPRMAITTISSTNVKPRCCFMVLPFLSIKTGFKKYCKNVPQTSCQSYASDQQPEVTSELKVGEVFGAVGAV